MNRPVRAVEACVVTTISIKRGLSALVVPDTRHSLVNAAGEPGRIRTSQSLTAFPSPRPMPTEKDKILLSGGPIIGTIPETVAFQQNHVMDGYNDRNHDFSGDCDQYRQHRN